MKMTRLSLLSLALVMSLVAAPSAFGKRPGGGGVGSPSLSKNTTACDGYYSWCYYEPIESCCYADHDTCLAACGRMCGGTCDDYTNEE